MAKRGAAWSGVEPETEEICGRRGRRLQVAKKRRNAFGKARQEVFLEHLAATCNVRRSAEAAEVTDGCVFAKRRRDPLFRAAWDEAIETGLARIEAMLVEHGGKTKPPEVRDGLELPPEPLDIELALHLWREHRKSLAGIPARRGPRQAAEWSEVEDYFIAKLKALKVRIGEEGGVPERTPPPAPLVPLPGNRRGGCN